MVRLIYLQMVWRIQIHHIHHDSTSIHSGFTLVHSMSATDMIDKDNDENLLGNTSLDRTTSA